MVNEQKHSGHRKSVTKLKSLLVNGNQPNGDYIHTNGSIHLLGVSGVNNGSPLVQIDDNVDPVTYKANIIDNAIKVPNGTLVSGLGGGAMGLLVDDNAQQSLNTFKKFPLKSILKNVKVHNSNNNETLLTRVTSNAPSQPKTGILKKSFYPTNAATVNECDDNGVVCIENDSNGVGGDGHVPNIAIAQQCDPLATVTDRNQGVTFYSSLVQSTSTPPHPPVPPPPSTTVPVSIENSAKIPTVSVQLDSNIDSALNQVIN